jgi:AcrR family transcriptional regulator
MAEQSQEAKPNRTLELLWGLRAASTRGPKATLNIENIAAAAVAVADTDGIDAVSMQRVAEDLSFTKMSLYRHVAGKADLIAVMIEHAVGTPPELQRVKGSWRPRLERWARALSASWEDHPWLPGVTVGSRVIGPNETGWVETAVAALGETPLSPTERMDVVTLLSGHLRNTHGVESAGTQPWHAGPWAYDRTHNEMIRERPDRFPALHEVAGRRTRTPRQTRDFGLRCLLDGVEQAIDARA